MGFRDLIFSDLRRYRPDEEPTWFRVAARCALNPGLFATLVMRLQLNLDHAGLRQVATVLRTVNVVLTGLDVMPTARIGPGVLIHHPSGVVIGAGATVGEGVTLMQHTTLGERYADGRAPHAYPTIADRVVIGVGACVLGGVHVGHDAVIGANAVVLSDVESHAVVGGIPARPLHRPRIQAVTSTDV